jgi:hypothetical protein
VLGKLGHDLAARDGAETADSQAPGIARTGAGNLNPAVVTVTTRAAGQGSKPAARDAAKEGLIKPHAGGKAAPEPPICTRGGGVVLVAAGAPDRLCCAVFLGR